MPSTVTSSVEIGFDDHTLPKHLTYSHVLLENKMSDVHETAACSPPPRYNPRFLLFTDVGPSVS
jgi:hypothetical protein